MEFPMKITYLISIIIHLVVLQKENSSVDYCYACDPTPTKRFATKSLYDFEKDVNYSWPNLKASCKPIQLWTIIRHGVRLAEPQEVPTLKNDLPVIQKEIIENYEKNATRLCEEDFTNIKNWKLDPLIDDASAFGLSDSGAQQMADLGDKFRKDYSSLLGFPFSEKNYIVHKGLEECITKSADIFLERVFNSTLAPLRNVKQDAKWFRDVKDPLNFITEESDKFTRTPLVREMIFNISEKLGYPGDRELNWTSVKLMYDMCRYDNAWHLDELSPWCAVFTPEHKNILEYQEDLACFYEYGYGNDMNIDMGCPSVKSMLYYFMKVANNEANQPKAILLFTHRGMLETFLPCLNAQKDPYLLTADNYEQVQNRKWKTSDDCPFSAHITATFYSCDETEKYVQFILNQEPLQLDYPGCVNGLCPWQSVLAHLKPIADDCVKD